MPLRMRAYIWPQLQLQVCCGQAQLLSPNHSTRHHVCHPPDCQVLIGPTSVTWWSNPLSGLLLEEDSWIRDSLQAWSQEGFQMLLWCRLLRTVEQGICSSEPQYFQVAKWMGYLLCRMPCLMGFQTSIPGCALYYRSQVHCHVLVPLWRHSYHGATTGNKGAKLQCLVYQALRVL